MTKRTIRLLLLALVAVLCCLALLIGSTFALFTDSVSVKNHLRAGTLKVSLVREKLTSYNITDDGSMKLDTDDSIVDFTESTKANVFGFSEDDRIVPTSYFIADMVISNSSDVAFVYWIEIVLKTDKSAAELAEQLTVTVKHGEAETSQSLNNGLSVGSSENTLGTVLVGEEAKFSVTIEFKNLENSVNDTAQDKEVFFDLVVYAVQATN